jgi:hypothetical protein
MCSPTPHGGGTLAVRGIPLPCGGTSLLPPGRARKPTGTQLGGRATLALRSAAAASGGRANGTHQPAVLTIGQ